MSFWKRQFPTIVVFVMGILMVIQYYVPHPASQTLLEESSRWTRIIRNCALLLGVASLVANHWRKIGRAQAGYGYSVVVFAGFFTMVSCGLFWGIDAPSESHRVVTVPAEIAQKGGSFDTGIEIRKAFGVMLEPAPGTTLPTATIKASVLDGQRTDLSDKALVWPGQEGKLVLDLPAGVSDEPVMIGVMMKERLSPGYWIFDTFKVSMEASMYSLLAFFVSSAAFRAFRARSFDATIMLAAAVIMMIGRVPFGENISRWFSETWLFFPKASDWLLNIPNLAAKRAIFLGIALSVIGTSIRIIFGLERSYLGRGE